MKLQISFKAIDETREQAILDSIKATLTILAAKGSVSVEVLDGDES